MARIAAVIDSSLAAFSPAAGWVVRSRPRAVVLRPPLHGEQQFLPPNRS